MTSEFILGKKQIHEGSWKSSYQYFPNLINEYQLKSGAEIGVAFGGHCEAILSGTQVAILYGIDPYQNVPNYADPMNLPQEDFDQLYKDTLDRLSVFGSRFELIRQKSADAINYVPNQLDFVYIDADHSFEGVRNDLRGWFTKIRDFGIIGGHDYDHPNFPGVKQAIDDFFARLGWNVNVEGDGVWWVQKQPVGISFFIPAYNCANTILESVNSILDGNFTDHDELVIVNDHSTDNTAAILRDLSVGKPFIKIIDHLRNKGGAAARNTAVENSKNNILFCLDSDNVLESASIGKLLSFLIASCCDISSFSEIRYFNSANPQETTHKWIYKLEPYSLADYFSGPVHPGSSGNYMFTKRSWGEAGGYPEFAGALDTWGFGFYQLVHGYKMSILPDSYYFHRFGHQSYWTIFSEANDVSLRALQIMLPFLGVFEDSSVEYILSSKHRHSWFQDLENHPLRIKKEALGRTGSRTRPITRRTSGLRLVLSRCYRFLMSHLGSGRGF